MRSWNIREAKIAVAWARTPSNERAPVSQIANRLGRTPGANNELLRRELQPGERPWSEAPRWGKDQVDALVARGEVERCSREAARRYAKRHGCTVADQDEDDDKQPRTVTQVANDLGISRASGYRLLKAGVPRRFKGSIAQTTLDTLLQEHPPGDSVSQAAAASQRMAGVARIRGSDTRGQAAEHGRMDQVVAAGAQVGEGWHQIELLANAFKAVAPLLDSDGIEIVEPCSQGDVPDAEWIDAHQNAADGVGGDRVIRESETAEVPRWAVERAVALHCFDAVYPRGEGATKQAPAAVYALRFFLTEGIAVCFFFSREDARQ